MDNIFMTYLIWAVGTLPALIYGDLDLLAVPADLIKDGGSLQLTCVLRPPQWHVHINSNDERPHESKSTEPRDNTKCHFRWNRSYYPTSRVTGTEQIDPSGKELYFYTSRDSKGVATKSTVTILEMKPHFEGTYTCYLDCPDHTESASIKIHLANTGSLFADQGAIIASIVAFVVIGVVLLVVGVKAFKDSCCFAARTRRSGSQTSSLIHSQISQNGEYMDPPPRYSVVVLASGSPESKPNTRMPGSGADGRKYLDRVADRLGSESSVESVLLLQPPDYEQAIKDLASKGIHFDLNDLAPMPPAYNDMPYIVDFKTPPTTPPVGASGDSSDLNSASSVLRMPNAQI